LGVEFAAELAIDPSALLECGGGGRGGGASRIAAQMGHVPSSSGSFCSSAQSGQKLSLSVGVEDAGAKSALYAID